jgi:predicted amidophosphoribosyltransferase
VFGLARGVGLNSLADVLVPVPLHWRRAWDRRHNQADGIARGLAAVLKLPVWGRSLWRVKRSPVQPASSREQRWANAAGAFRVAPWASLTGVRVLLIDDVLTTGATADAAADALCRGGAAQVHVAVLAHR